jgi:GTP-binding protein Era
MKAGFVALVGRPNAGKSTLLNRLVGERLAIVSDKPQTTRTRILAVRNLPDAQIVFIDTPGVHRPLHKMNVRMMHEVRESLRDVDVLGVLVDVSEPPGGGDRYLMQLLDEVSAPVVLILNKIDRIPRPALLPIIDRYRQQRSFADIVPVSAMTGENVDRLEQVVREQLPEGEALYPPDYLTDQPERFFVAEIVREKILQQTHAELPFSTAVVVDRFEEPDAKGLMRLYCTILVDRASQKPILVGQRGARIKAIGTAARADLEEFFQARVFLDLHVKVRSQWRDDERVLDDLGLRRLDR